MDVQADPPGKPPGCIIATLVDDDYSEGFKILAWVCTSFFLFCLFVLSLSFFPKETQPRFSDPQERYLLSVHWNNLTGASSEDDEEHSYWRNDRGRNRVFARCSIKQVADRRMKSPLFFVVHFFSPTPFLSRTRQNLSSNTLETQQRKVEIQRLILASDLFPTLIYSDQMDRLIKAQSEKASNERRKKLIINEGFGNSDW